MTRLTTKQRLLWTLAVAGMLAMLGESTAQKNRGGAKVQTAGINGTITGVANGMMQVKNKHGDDKWLVKPGPDGITQYLGTAPKEWLRPGMVVMVTGAFDRKGVATDPVVMIQAFTPRPGRVVGVVADPSGLGGESGKNASKSYILSGPIKSIEDGNLIIIGGRKKFTVPMADDAEVTVDLLGDLSWVKEGDTVVGKVKYVQKGKGLSTELSVTGKEELAPPPPKPLTKKEQRAKAMREKKAAAEKAQAEAAASKDAEAAETEEAAATDG